MEHSTLWLTHIECCMTESHSHPRTHLLGTSGWSGGFILVGFLATNVSSAPTGKHARYLHSHATHWKPTSCRFLEDFRSYSSLVGMEINTQGPQLTDGTATWGHGKTRLAKENLQPTWTGYSLLGSLSYGTFTIKEAYGLKAQFHLQPKDKIWSVIWKSNLWPKVNIFLWLLVQNRILTWDNLRKRGFIGPSTCPLFLSKRNPWNTSLINAPLVHTFGIMFPKP
jgi:hypothetical protein